MADSTTARHVSLLRGINVGGNNKIPMARLREVYESVGCSDVATYLQSGNVVFRRTAPTNAGAEVAAVLKRDVGLDIAILDRTHDELVRIMADDPFPTADPSKRVVVFLSDALTAAQVAELSTIATGRESLTARSRELHLHCPDGLGRSKLAVAVGKKQLGVVATARNWRTVSALVALSAEGLT